MSITFAVSDVDRPGQLMAVLDRTTAIRSLLGGGDRTTPRWPSMAARMPPPRRVEAFSSSTARLVCANDAHALAQAAHDAFYLHHPLVLSPDAVWFCIAQQLDHICFYRLINCRQAAEIIVADRAPAANDCPALGSTVPVGAVSADSVSRPGGWPHD